MTNHISCGTFRQRVGGLIEAYIIGLYSLTSNQRQRTQGYYDGYNDTTLFEVKASSITNNRFTIKVDNHKKLLAKNGEYLFVSYSIKDKDKDLKLISDIIINDIYQVSAQDINETLIEHGQKNVFNETIKTRSNKDMYRIMLRFVKACEGVTRRGVT